MLIKPNRTTLSKPRCLAATAPQALGRGGASLSRRAEPCAVLLSTFAPRRRSGKIPLTSVKPNSTSGQGFGSSQNMEEKMEEVQAQDMLIDALLEVSQSDQQLMELVSESLLSLNKDFWLRFAIRTDMCEEGGDREKMAQLANKVMKITEEVVKQSEKSLDNAQSWLIKILQQAADDQGQWHLPLSAGEIDKMRQFMKENFMNNQNKEETSCDLESLLATTYAWMRKATDDEEQGGGQAQNVVPLLQKVLQLYASEFLLNFDPSTNPQLGGIDDPLMDLMMGKGLEESAQNKSESEDQEQKQKAKGSAASEALESVLKSDEESWNDQLQKLVEEETCTEESLLVELQKKKEIIILGMRGGMYEQRVLVEYLQELEERIQRAFGSTGTNASTEAI